MTQDDPGNIALVMDDLLAPRVLVWWRSTQSVTAHYNASDCADVCDADVDEIEATVRRLTVAGLILDGGISMSAARWLSSIALTAISRQGKKSQRD